MPISKNLFILSGLILMVELYIGFNINLSRGKYLGFREFLSFFSAAGALFALLSFLAALSLSGNSRKFVLFFAFACFGICALNFARDLWTVSTDYLRFQSVLRAKLQQLETKDPAQRCEAAAAVLAVTSTYSDLPGVRSGKWIQTAHKAIQETINQFPSIPPEQVKTATQALFSLYPNENQSRNSATLYQQYDLTGLQAAILLPPQDRRGQMAALLLARITNSVPDSAEPFLVQILSDPIHDEYQEYFAIQSLQEHSRKSQLSEALKKALRSYLQKQGIPETDSTKQIAKGLLQAF